MSPDTVLHSLHQTIALWEKQLDNYSLEQLCIQPGKESWSLGQVYTHLLDNTFYYNFPQIEICISNNRNARGKKSAEGTVVFARNSFPNKKLKAPPFEAIPAQPESIEQLKKGLLKVRKIIITLEKKIRQSQYRGKTKHPGLAYLDAWDWMQFIDIHFRHHLWQKKRIDLYLRSENDSK